MYIIILYIYVYIYIYIYDYQPAAGHSFLTPWHPLGILTCAFNAAGLEDWAIHCC